MGKSAGNRPVAIITGAAGGLGSIIAPQMARNGFDVVVSDLRENDAMEAACEAVRKEGGKAWGIVQDLAKVDELKGFVDRAYETCGRVDCLVNNAGVSVHSRGDMLDVTPESFDLNYAVNLRGPFFLTQHVAKRMLADRRNGVGDHFKSIVTISSVGTDHMIGKVVSEYCIIKTATAVMTKHYAVRLAAEGIDCYDVRPGMMPTSMTASSKEKYDGLIAQGYVPSNRWAELDEIGHTIASLANGALRYTVGQSIWVDGGMALKVF
ncbi:MAG: 3-ketoacyl-ACP reductase [Rhodobiaceae bacterium]|nr:3-ketoacyl-ACP reductase [Rhodobiaceae bacterium]MCC0056059.1 3-ketoacyl-ACP reductase [Rhodobiaceae bacterium]